MSTQFASEELNVALKAIQESKDTGCISIDHLEGQYHRYGTLQFQNGQLTGAQYRHESGQKALEMIQDLRVMSLSYAQGAIVIS